MFGKPHKLPDVAQLDTERDAAPSAKEETARLFSLALDEAHWARLRAQQRIRVIGVHGTDFEDRDARVELVVEKFNDRAVKTARKNALRAGWTKDQLASLELSGAARLNGAAQGSGSAQA